MWLRKSFPYLVTPRASVAVACQLVRASKAAARYSAKQATPSTLRSQIRVRAQPSRSKTVGGQ